MQNFVANPLADGSRVRADDVVSVLNRLVEYLNLHWFESASLPDSTAFGLRPEAQERPDTNTEACPGNPSGSI
jgi:hypothetical protein